MATQTPSSKADVVKLTLAIVALLVAGSVIAWNFGVFDDWFRPKPTDPMAGLTKEEQQEVKLQEQRNEERAKITPPS